MAEGIATLDPDQYSAAMEAVQRAFARGTGEATSAGREVFLDAMGNPYSEKTVTIPYSERGTVTIPYSERGMEGFVVVPSVDVVGGTLSEEELARFIRENGPVDPVTGRPLPVFPTLEAADAYAVKRSEDLGAELEARKLRVDGSPGREPRPTAQVRIGEAVVTPQFYAEGSLGGPTQAGPNIVNRFTGEDYGAPTQQTFESFGKLGATVDLPGGVRLGGGSDLRYMRGSYELPEALVRRFDIPKEAAYLKYGDRGIQAVRPYFSASVPAAGGELSLDASVQRSPEGSGIPADRSIHLGWKKSF